MENNNIIKNEALEVRHLKAGNRFSLDVYDKDNNLILKAHTPITEGILNHLTSVGTDKLYFDSSKIKNKDQPIHKAILSEELINEAYNHTKNVLEEIRETLI